MDHTKDFAEFWFKWRVRNAYAAMLQAESTWQDLLAEGSKRGLKINQVVDIARGDENGVQTGEIPAQTE